MKVTLHLFDLEVYRNKILPAYHAFTEHGDRGPILRILTGLLESSRASSIASLPPSSSTEIVEEFIGIISGKVYYSSIGETEGERTTFEDLRVFVDRSAMPLVIQCLCLPLKEFDPEQDMSGDLALYLYEKSPWVEKYFTFAQEPSGIALEVTPYDSGSLFSAVEVLEFDSELASIAPPSGEPLSGEYENLVKIVRAAKNEDSIALCLSVT